ncbi:Ig-like domain-containing protein [Microbacterium terrisoli]|uniref:Ig-like domain-containing protein n=1 Tax=Microbacterium terrisoli TaxID=3242192 RepID=UPI00280610A3|nr:Ig-like domain-containing protein [Microbacterium protaetiae]
MGVFARLRARPRTIAAAGAVTVAAVVVTTLAVVYQGNPTTQVDLNDGSVWVTKQSALMVGHFNDQSRVLDGGLRTATDDYDILQSGQTVLMHDVAGHSVSTVDPSTVALSGSAKIAAGAQVALGGETVAILDPAKGALWVMPAAAVAAFTPGGMKPQASLGAGAAVTVGTDGTVYGVSASSQTLVTVPVDAQGAPLSVQRQKLDGLGESAEVSVTAVGTVPVVLDAASGVVLSDAGLRGKVSGTDAVLQQPSQAEDAVAIATASGLVRVPLDGSAPAVRDAGGTGIPAAPVRLNGCTYGAWAGSGRFVRDCAAETDDLARAIPALPANAQLQFRQNRDVVVLNDIIGGSAWLASDALDQVDNWDDLTPPKGETEDNQEQVTQDTVQSTLPKRSKKNTSPIANPDGYGVRPGRTTVLPVLENDTDADGDVLTVTVPEDGPRLGELQAIDRGSGLQLSVPADAAGSDGFTYKVDDGRRGTDTARVRLSVHPWSQNEAPRQSRVTSLTMEAGGVLTYNVLPDWRDPDGDNVYLKSAEAAPGDEVQATNDGRITYRALSGTLGTKEVKVHVSDGEKVADGTIRLTVRPRGSTKPVATADHVLARAGRSVTVSPLVNDYSAGSQELRLTRVEDVAGAEISRDFQNKTFSFRAEATGTYYVQYLIAAGTATADGVVRVDVMPDRDGDAPPVAVQDTALLPTGGDALVNVLANDSDPAGGILVVQSVSVPESAGISVAVLGHETLRVIDRGTLAEQVTIGYTISNGTRSAVGQVVVIPVPAPSTLRPPAARDDTAVVRAGDVVTIPVLENDIDPNGGTLHVAPDLVPPLVEAKDGMAFVSQNTVRFKAGGNAGTVHLTYEAVDATGQKDAGYVTIQVLPVSEKTNQAPRPTDRTARVLSGSKVRVSVPLDGIDPDGDSVQLVGLASAPAKGRVVATGADYVDYQADGALVGADSFTYRVRDRLGAEATATVRIGIAPASSANQAPYAVKDAMAMRPGRTVSVPALTNDSDPDGDPIGLVAGGLTLSDAPGLSAKVSGDRVEVTAPDRPTDTSLQYTIQDARGAQAIGVLQITVKDDVPLLRPIARDDRVQPTDIEDGQVDLDVLANDEDPDATIAALTLAVVGGRARVVGDRVHIAVTDRAQLIAYTITDQDAQTATAFVWVPALASVPPTLVSTTGVTVGSGQRVELPLDEYVQVAGGGDVVITEAGRVAAVHGNGDPLVKDQRTLVYTSAKDYFGPDAITFEVTDGTGPDDPRGTKATLVLPITVTPPANQPPTFTNGQLRVAPGEAASSIDLRALTADPDEGDLARVTYSLTGDAPRGLSARVQGQRLEVSADASTPKGTAVALGLQITDGETAPVAGAVTVTVIASARPPATANDDVVPIAHQGESVRVDVLANDVNPFAKDGKPLSITGAVVETGQGGAEVAGDHVQVAPDEAFVGRMVVRYTVQDATADPDRRVDGRIILTVQGVPGTPGRPTVSSVQDRTVVLSWTPPVDNGAPITAYTVGAVGGGYSRTCEATTCTLDGLTNNVEYTFTVTATNAVGDSPASAPSEPARPDARPDTPEPPTLAYADRSLQVSWKTPPTPGSPVESFTLEISPAPPSGIATKSKVVGNELTWDGLENGVAYQVRVQALNRAPEPSSWSAWSATQIPARAPEAPARPSTSMLDPVGSQAQMQVSWTAPADNGDAVSGYELAVMRGSSTLRTLAPAAGATSQAVVVDTSTTDYTYRLRARNKAGWGAWSPVSAARRGVIAPGAPGTPSVKEGDRSLAVSFAAAEGNGATSGEIRYQYSVNNQAWSGSWTGTSGTISGLVNGTGYTVRVRAVSTVDGTAYPGTASPASATKTPYGTPGTAGARASASGTSITYSWSPPAPNGRSITGVLVKIDGGSWVMKPPSGSTSGSYGYSQTHTIAAKAVDSLGNEGPQATASATTMAKPKPHVWAEKGVRHDVTGCTASNCYNAILHWENWDGPSNPTVWCAADGVSSKWSGHKVNMGSASGTWQSQCAYGGGAGGHQRFWFVIDGWGNSDPVSW